MLGVKIRQKRVNVSSSLDSSSSLYHRHNHNLYTNQICIRVTRDAEVPLDPAVVDPQFDGLWFTLNDQPSTLNHDSLTSSHVWCFEVYACSRRLIGVPRSSGCSRLLIEIEGKTQVYEHIGTRLGLLGVSMA